MFAQPARQAASRFRSQSQRSASSAGSSGGSDWSSESDAANSQQQQQQQQLTAPIHNGQGIFRQSQSSNQSQSQSEDGFELVSSIAGRGSAALSATSTSSPSISVSSAAAREPLSPILTSDVSLFSEPSAAAVPHEPKTQLKALRRRASEVHDLDLFQDALIKPSPAEARDNDDDLFHSIHALSAGLNPSIRPRRHRSISRQRNKRPAIQSDASSNKRSCQSLRSSQPDHRCTATASASTSRKQHHTNAVLRHHRSALQSLLRIDSETCALLATQPAGSTHVDRSWKVSEHIDQELGHLPSLQAALLEVSDASRPSSASLGDHRSDGTGSWWSDVARDPASSIWNAYDYCHRYLSSSIPV